MFLSTNLQINRGVTTANAQGKFTLVRHSYIDKNETVTNIINSFPPYFGQGESQEFIFVGDLIDINGSDKVSVNEILNLNPVTLGPDLYVESSIIVDAPIAAVDANAIKITSDVLQMEIADVAHPGIITETSQVFGGTKTFAHGVRTDTLDTPVGSTPLEIGQTNANIINLHQNTKISAGKKLQTDNLDATSAGTLSIGLTAAALTLEKNTTMPGGTTLTTPGVIFSGSTGLQALAYYETFTFSTTFTNNGDTTTSTDVVITRVGNLVTMRFSNEVTGTAPGSPAPNYTSDVQIPSRFMSAINPLNGWWRVTDNGILKTGLIQFDGSGSIYIFSDPNQSITWTASASMAISACAFSWVI